MAILNLPTAIWNLARVNEWSVSGTNPIIYPLQNAFELCTRTNPSETDPALYKYFFDNIWIPVKKMFTDQNVQLTPEEFLAAEYVWVNIGLTPQEISESYQTLYGMNYLSVPLMQQSLNQCIRTLGAKMKAIFNLNKGKYLKLLDLQGLSYNPLWNVDGTEIRQTLENEGVNDVSSKAFSSDHGGTSDDVKRSHNAAPYDGDGTASKLEWEEETKGGNTALDSIPQYGYDSSTDQWTTSAGSLQNLSGETMSASGSRNETKYTHRNAENGINDTSEGGYGTDYVVQAVDTAFGQMLVGGDKMHVEKYLRQGNIGVTKSTELIEAEREILRFSVLKEFFDDINEQLLVGIY